MCGRYSLKTSPDELIRDFGLSEIPPIEARYNIAPAQTLPVIRLSHETGKRECVLMRWGLVPFWADDPKVGYRTINAKAETAAKSPAYRAAFRYRRCLVPADGFFEWKKVGRFKQPMYIHRKDDRPFAFAGLWEHWQRATGEPLDTYTILTGDPNDVVRPIHNRMPVIVNPDAYDRWLDPAFKDPKAVQALLGPYPSTDLIADPISTRINNPRNDDPGCLQRPS